MNIIEFIDEMYYFDECEQKIDESGWMGMKLDEGGRD